MGTTTSRSSDPRTPVQRRGNILVLFVVLAMAGAIIYSYTYVSSSKSAGPSAEVPRSLPTANAPLRTTSPAIETPSPASSYNGESNKPTTAASPVTQ